ncbi:hypothetical protein BCR44DRAFT_231857, partial [Catenaria anguillulae PL171]
MALASVRLTLCKVGTVTATNHTRHTAIMTRNSSARHAHWRIIWFCCLSNVSCGFVSIGSAIGSIGGMERELAVVRVAASVVGCAVMVAWMNQQYCGSDFVSRFDSGLNPCIHAPCPRVKRRLAGMCRVSHRTTTEAA